MLSSTVRMRTLGAALLAVAALLLAGCGDEGRRDAPSTPGATGAAAKPKLAIIYSADWKDGSWGEFAYDGANDAEGPGRSASSRCRTTSTRRRRPERPARARRRRASTRSSPTRSTTATTSRRSPPTTRRRSSSTPAASVTSRPTSATTPSRSTSRPTSRASSPPAPSGGQRRRRRRLRHPRVPGDEERLPRRAPRRSPRHDRRRSSPSATGTTCRRPRRRRIAQGDAGATPVHRLRPGPDVRPDRGGQRERRRVDGLRRRHVRPSARRCSPRSPGTWRPCSS